MRSAFEYKSEWSGLENRLAHMFDSESGRTVMLAVDHGYFHGAPDGLKDLRKTVEPLLPYCDAISPCIGSIKCLDQKTKVPIILRATGGNSMTKPDDLDDEIITVPIPEIIKNNAIGFTVSCYIGMPHQRQTLKNLTELASEGHKYGLIAIGITAVGKGLGKDLKYLEHASRVLVENGADIIKTYYCDGFEQLINSCHVPVVIAGGKKLPTKQALEFTYNAVNSGACGVDMGRNIFKNQNPVAMIQAVRSIVHKGNNAKDAYDFYRELGGQEE